MDNTGRLAQANGRLRAGKVGIVIEAKGSRLLLRGTLPPRPTSTKAHPHQQRIALGYRFNPEGIKLAEAEARKVGALVQCGEFDWSPYLRAVAPLPSTAADQVERFERHYFTRRRRNEKSQTTWDLDYWAILKRLGDTQGVTADALMAIVEATEPDSRQRKRACMVLSQFADFCGIEVDLKPLAGGYSPSSVLPQDLPDDDLIAACFHRIPHAQWRWAYGVMATYGIRPSELFSLDLSDLPILTITEGSKTKRHRTWPLYPEWVEAFDVANPQPPEVTGKSNSDRGHRIAVAFGRYKIPFSPKMLRHAWAVRAIRFGIPVELAAQQQGHSVQVHTQVYHRWITDRTHQEAFAMAMRHPDRPQAPTVTLDSDSLHN